MSELARQENSPPSLDGGPPIARAPEAGTWAQVKALALYMTKTQVHTYAFSVAANVILALAPFIVLILTVTREVFHSNTMWAVVSDLMSHFLPSNQTFVMRNMEWLARPHKEAQIFSIAMLLFTSTGVFLPLEVALNEVWGVKKNRNYLHNQAVSLGLASAVSLLVLASVAVTAAQKSMLAWIFFGHTGNFVFSLVASGFLRVFALVSSIAVFFLIYWVLPYRKIPVRAVWPTAVVIGILWEVAKYLYILALPHLDFPAVYGPFSVSVGLMMWAFLSGLLLLGGAYVSATRQALREANQAEE